MSLAEEFDAFLLDLDGVVWRGEVPVRGAPEAIMKLRELDRRLVFVTNNSSRTPREYAIKLMRMGIPTATSDIVTSGHAIVSALRKLGVTAGDRVHVCGGEGLVRLLARERFAPTRETEAVKAVAVGWNPKGTLEDVRKAADLAREGVPLLASNADPTYPTDDGVLPGTGAVLAAIEVASGTRARVVGKPEPELFRLALERAEVPADRALFCGDRPETDVVGARRAGVPVALVLSGVTTDRDLGSLAAVPDEILDALPDLLADEPRVRVERREEGLAALGDRELAVLECSRNGGRIVLHDLRLAGKLDPRFGWRVVRRLLVEAVWEATEVEATEKIHPYLERIGVDAGPQARLFKG